MTTASSGSLANIREYAKFNYGVGMMPYDADAKDAPQNAIIGGASLWVMQGKDKETYTGAGEKLAVGESSDLSAHPALFLQVIIQRQCQKRSLPEDAAKHALRSARA